MAPRIKTTVNEHGETVMVMRKLPMQIDVVPMLALVERLGLSGPLMEICRRNNVLLDQVLVGVRSKSVVRARAECCVHLRSLQMSYPEIAKVLGMNQSSPIYSIRKLMKEREGRGDGEGSST